jgi:hypothetical protein
MGRPLRWSALATALFVPNIAARRPPLEHHCRIPRGRGERLGTRCPALIFLTKIAIKLTAQFSAHF